MEKEQDKEGVVDSLPCPSFNSYSSNKLADIAERVSRDDHFGAQNDVAVSSRQNDETDFEFVAFRKAADGVFFDGDVGPVFPVFNRDLLTKRGGELDSTAAEALQFPMRRLLIGGGGGDSGRERDPPASSSESESEADDLEGIPAGTYCVWTPNSSNSVEASPSSSRCKKSNSTGSSSCSSSKRWKLLDLLRRSNSDGKDSFVFLTPTPSPSSVAVAKKKNVKEELSSGRMDGGRVAGKQKKVVSAHEALYVRNRELRRVDKRRSYLPYRQDLVGFCASLSGFGKAFPSF